jgi:plastocyanin
MDESLSRVLGCLLLAVAAAPALAARLDVQVQAADGRPLPGAVVYLDSPAARAASRPVTGAEIEQADKRFTQTVTVVTAGSQIHFPNRDKVRHHVFSFSPAKTFEIKLYTGTPANPVLFDRPGLVVLGCNIHDTMLAWVLVVETPWHGQTNPLGQWRAPAVPAGSYTLQVWHPDLPTGTPPQGQALQVGAADASVVVRLAGVTGAR